MIEIASYSDHFENEIRKLFKICFDRDISHKEWSWKYKESPWGAESYIALYNGKIISHYGGIRYKFYKHGTPLWAYGFCDVMTHPDFRGRIMSSEPPIVKLGNRFYKEKEMNFAFGFPSERHARLQTLMLGGSKPGWVKMYTKELKVNKIGAFMLNMGIIDKLKPLFCKFHLEDDLSYEIDEIWKNSREDYPLTLDKNSKYIYWRYKKCPTKHYEPIAFRNPLTGKIITYIVVKYKNEKMEVLDILRKRDSNLSLIFYLIELFAIESECKFISLWSKQEEPLSRFLLKSGYEESTSVPYAVKIVNDEQINEEYFFDNYCYGMGDYDDS